MWIMFGYPGFNQFPPGRIVLISRRESPDTVEVVGQHHHRVDRKRTLGINVAKSLPHEINGHLIAEQPPSQRGDDSDKVSTARHECSSILHDPNPNCRVTPGMSDYASLIRPTGFQPVRRAPKSSFHFWMSTCRRTFFQCLCLRHPKECDFYDLVCCLTIDLT